MNNFPSKETVERLRKQYPPGTRVELIRMNDPYSKLKPGDQGTVDFVDDTGTLFCHWDCGGSLGVVYGVDAVIRMNMQKQPKENHIMNDTIREQILSIRASGVTNMFDLPRVQHEAYVRGFHELVIYLEEHKAEYSRFILTGETGNDK